MAKCYLTMLALLLAMNLSVFAKEKATKSDLILPKLKLNEVTVAEALEEIKKLSKDVDPEGKGIAIIIQEKEKNKEALARKVTLDLNDIPVKEVVKYVIIGSGLSMTINQEQNTLVISSKKEEQLVTNFYRVSSSLPSFVSPQDVTKASNEAKLKEFFTSTGVTFSEKARISFNPGTSSLSMTNTEENHTKLNSILTNLGVIR